LAAFPVFSQRIGSAEPENLMSKKIIAGACASLFLCLAVAPNADASERNASSTDDVRVDDEEQAEADEQDELASDETESSSSNGGPYYCWYKHKRGSHWSSPDKYDYFGNVHTCDPHDHDWYNNYCRDYQSDTKEVGCKKKW
jgi:hypothetical protein